MDLIEILQENLKSSDGCDNEARLVLADALEEIGRTVEANGQRWQALNDKRPLVMKLNKASFVPRAVKDTFGFAAADRTRAGWFSCARMPINETTSVVLIPFKDRIRGWVWFKTIEKAELALAQALEELEIQA